MAKCREVAWGVGIYVHRGGAAGSFAFSSLTAGPRQQKGRLSTLEVRCFSAPQLLGSLRHLCVLQGLLPQSPVSLLSFSPDTSFRLFP